MTGFGRGALAAFLLLGGGSVARAQGRVVVYTAQEAAIVEQLVPRFQKETGITVDLVKGGSGDMVNRVRAEAGNPRADVIWSVGGDLLSANPNLIQPYKPAGYEAVLDPKFGVKGDWLPYTGVIMVLAVNTQKLQPGGYPRSWADLADAKWKGKVSSARADSSASAFIQYATVLGIFGDKGPELYRRIFSNFALSDSSGAVPRYVNDGEALVGITLEDNALQYVRGGGKVAIVYPSEGTSLTADGVALVKGAPDAEAGRKFIDWVLSQPIQQWLVEKVGRRSIRRDVAASSVLPPLSEINIVSYDLDGISRDRAKLVAAWKKVAESQ